MELILPTKCKIGQGFNRLSSSFRILSTVCVHTQRLGQDDSLTNELADRTKAEIEIIKKDYVANKDGVLDFISRKVLDVDIVIGAKKVAILRNYAERGVDP